MKNSDLCGLVIATQTWDENHSQINALIRIGGITLLERQIRMLLRLGINRALILTRARKNEITHVLRKKKFIHMDIEVITAGASDSLESSALFHQHTGLSWLLMDGALLFDWNFLKNMQKETRDKICLMSSRMTDESDTDLKRLLTFQDQRLWFAGCARLSSKRVAEIDFSDDKTWFSDLQRFLDEDKELGFAFSWSADKPYIPKPPPVWMPIDSPQNNRPAKRILIHAAQKRVLDWPAWFIHRPLENGLIYILCEWPVTPNQLTFLTTLTAFVTTYFFATGKTVSAIILALIVGILDGLDGKQARVKEMTSRFGKIEHVFDKIYEDSWYLAIGFFLYQQGGGVIPWILSGTMVLTNLADVIIVWAFRKEIGVDIDCSGSLERKLRWVAGRRNIYIWILIPFVFLTVLYEGLIVISAYACITFLIRLWRLRAHLVRKKMNRKAVK